MNDIFSIEYIIQDWTKGNSLKAKVLREVFSTEEDGEISDIDYLGLLQIEGCDYFNLFTDYELTSEIYHKYCYEIEQILKHTNKEKNQCIQQYWRTYYTDSEEIYSQLAVQFVTQWYVKVLLKYIDAIPVTVKQEK